MLILRHTITFTYIREKSCFSSKANLFINRQKKLYTKIGEGNVVNKVQFLLATDEGAMTKQHIHKRLKTINCEWLCRPSVASSELSDSITNNSQVLSTLHILHRAPNISPRWIRDLKAFQIVSTQPFTSIVFFFKTTHVILYLMHTTSALVCFVCIKKL